MPYSTRNALYLRISSWTVLPLYLYLDERHVRWMTDDTLQAVLADLRPKLLKKFHAEDPNMTKKSTVEVHRGATYQFAFFFRKTDARHVVLLKKREYIPRAVPRAKPELPSAKRRRVAPTPPPDRPRPQRASSKVNYAEELLVSPSPSPPLAQLDQDSAPGAEQPLFFPAGEDPRGPVTVKSEPEDIDLPLRSDAEKREMYAGARESLSRTGMDTGFEDPGDSGGREGSEELVSFRAVDDGEEEGKDVKADVKPLLRLSYKGFSISSRHLVLIIEPYPALPTTSSKSARARSTYSRSMSRATGVERDTALPTPGPDSRNQTPLVPNSRRGGTGSVFTAPTPGPAADRWTPVPNSRAGGSFRPSTTPAARDARGTPLFRDITPMSEFGDAPRAEALFADEGGSSEEEEKEWRRKVRGSSYAPWRGASVLGGEEEWVPSRARPDDSDDSDDIDDPESDDDDDDGDAEEVAQARRLMALSQRLQGNTEGRKGAVGVSGGSGVEVGELGGGNGDDYDEDDVGGADA